MQNKPERTDVNRFRPYFYAAVFRVMPEKRRKSQEKFLLQNSTPFDRICPFPRLYVLYNTLHGRKGNDGLLGVCVRRKLFARRAAPVSFAEMRKAQSLRLESSACGGSGRGGGARLSASVPSRMGGVRRKVPGRSAHLRSLRAEGDGENPSRRGRCVFLFHLCAGGTAHRRLFLFRRGVRGKRIRRRTRARRARAVRRGNLRRGGNAASPSVFPLSPHEKLYLRLRSARKRTGSALERVFGQRQSACFPRRAGQSRLPRGGDRASGRPSESGGDNFRGYGERAGVPSRIPVRRACVALRKRGKGMERRFSDPGRRAIEGISDYFT